MDIEVVHQTTGQSRFEKTLAILVGLAAILAALLATLEMHSNKRWEESSVHAADLSVELFGKIAATGPFNAAAAGSGQVALLSSVEAAVRVKSAGEQETRLALALVEQRVTSRLLKLSEMMGEVPDTGYGLDRVAHEVISTDITDLAEIASAQREEVESSDRYGGRISRAVFSLSLLALAAILLGLGAVLGLRGGGALILATATIAMLVAAGWGGSALLL